MKNDTVHSAVIETAKISSSVGKTEPCDSAAESANSSNKIAGNNVIDFKGRTSELRIKGMQSVSVSPFEATKALAFGLMYLNGEGVNRDLSQAARFLTTAAKGGVAQARYELARLHLDATGVPYDPEYAIELLQSASDDGHAPSTVYLAELLIFGKHCLKDLEEALELLYSVAAQNEPSAMYYLAYIYDRDLEHSNAFEAAYWYRRAAEYGHFKSQIRLAALYATGKGVPHCPETAEAFLEVALDSLGEQDPRYLLWQGEHFNRQPETEFLAHALIKAAADMEHTPAKRVMMQRGWRG